MTFLASLLLAGCGQPGNLQVQPGLRRGPTAAAVRATDADAALVKAVTLQAHAALAALDETCAALKLNTPGGRRFTPEQEVRLREGLTPALARLDRATDAIAARLRAEALTTRVRGFTDRFDAIAPVSGVDATPTATGLLFRVSQYRVKLGAVIDFALEHGYMTDLPTRERPDGLPKT
ncbi:MAG: hypothetical protein VKS61_15275 [Candidatus Sericytochromatia bacterium]|nr:hypothetical protein [Candidatus Sericytochromatia bacterium]